MLTKNKNLVIQNTDYINEPIYRDKRYWTIDTAYIYDKGNVRTVEDNERFCYLKINPYDLENMEYTLREQREQQENPEQQEQRDSCYVSPMGHDLVVLDYFNLLEKTRKENILKI
jgi:hypothetical protein